MASERPCTSGSCSEAVSLWTSQNTGYAGTACEAVHPAACPAEPPGVYNSEMASESEPYDGTQVDPGQAITKSWTLTNIGNRPWVAGEFAFAFTEDGSFYQGAPRNQRESRR